MAVSTVSSLAESFMSGGSLGSEEGILNKDKTGTPQELGTQDENPVDQGIITGNGQKSEQNKDEAEESSELTEQSDDEGGMLEVHN